MPSSRLRASACSIIAGSTSTPDPCAPNSLHEVLEGRRPSRMRRQGPRRPHPSPQEGRSAGYKSMPPGGKRRRGLNRTRSSMEGTLGAYPSVPASVGGMEGKIWGGAPGATRRATRRATRSKLWPHQGALVRTQASRRWFARRSAPGHGRDWVHGADGKSSHRGDGLREVRTRSRGAPFVVLP